MYIFTNANTFLSDEIEVTAPIAKGGVHVEGVSRGDPQIVEIGKAKSLYSTEETRPTQPLRCISTAWISFKGRINGGERGVGRGRGAEWIEDRAG
jgi:hypothetical protein